MIGLPDIGDPFDVDAFRSFRIPEENDALILFRQAEAKLSRMPHLPNTARRTLTWSKATPELRDWAATNRDALEIFRLASERPDALVHQIPERDASRELVHLADFAWLGLLEASRLEERGDMAAAWSLYRAVIRMKVHVLRRGSTFQRYVVTANWSGLPPRLTNWAADPRTTVPMLRQALEEIKAGEPRPEWDAFSLKVDYLELMTELAKDWGWVQQGEEEDQHVRIAGEDLPPGLGWIPYAAKRYVVNDPERSRRVLRLAFANWLAHVENSDPRFLKPAVRVRLSRGRRAGAIAFYPVSAIAPAAARALSPQDMAQQLLGTRDARLLLASWLWPSIRLTDRREHRALVVMLAGELFKRDRGQPPPSEEALVGTYLDHLPSDGSEELDDGSAPLIE